MGIHRGLAEQTFSEELLGPEGQPWRGIQSKDILEFTLDCFDALCPEWFWERAASRSGKYHPEISLGEGGLVRHVRMATWLGVENCRAMDTYPADLTPRSKKIHTVHQDLVIAALLLHDVLKDGDPELDAERGIRRKDDGSLDRQDRNTNHRAVEILGCHGVDMANAVIRRVLKGRATQEQAIICRAIAGHMGVWTTPEKYRPQEIKHPETRLVVEIVAMSDYTASRKIDGFSQQLMSASVLKPGQTSAEQAA